MIATSDEAMLEAALNYAAMGWPVFPCNSVKEPLTLNGVLDATTDPEKIKAMWRHGANIGCHVGAAGMMVVDLDDGHDMAEVHRVFGGMPATKLVQHTPSGGTHHFFALAEGEQVAPSQSKVAHDVDIRSHNSYVLLAPSRTIEGPRSSEGEYEWEHTRDQWPAPPIPKPAYRTDQMVRVSGTATAKHKNAEVWLIEPDLDENITAAVEWIGSDDCQPAVMGKGGNAMTYNTAAMMRSFGLSEDKALEVLMATYNETKCVPRWEIDEITTPIGNAYRYATSPPGNRTAAYKREVIKALLTKIEPTDDRPGTRAQVGRFVALDTEADDMTPDPEWLIPDLIQCATYVMVVGKPGSFKTFIALDLALSIAVGDGAGNGRAWPSVPHPGAAVFAAGEGGAGLKLRRRAWEVLHHAGKPVRDFIRVTNVPQINSEADALAFIEVAKALRPAGYRVAVIDTAMRAMQGANSNTQEAASALTKLVSMIAAALAPDEYGCTVVVLHHPAGADDKAAGSFVFEGDPDTTITVRREGKEPRVSLQMKKQKDAPEWEGLRFVAMHTVDLGAGKSSLVTVTASEAPMSAVPAPAEEADPPRRRRVETDPVVLDCIARAIVETIERNGGHPETNEKMVGMLLDRPDVEALSKTSMRKILATLQSDKARPAYSFWDAKMVRWRKGTGKQPHPSVIQILSRPPTSTLKH